MAFVVVVEVGMYVCYLFVCCLLLVVVGNLGWGEIEDGCMGCVYIR